MKNSYLLPDWRPIGQRFFKLWLFAFLLLPSLAGLAQSLTEAQKAKLDPVFVLGLLEPSPQRAVLPQQKGLIVATSPLNTSPTGAGRAEPKYQAIIYTENPGALAGSGIEVGAVLPTFVTANVTARQLVQVASLPSVRYVAAPTESYPTNREEGAAVGANLLNQGFLYGTNYRGQGVIVCIFDSGIDWRHADFRKADNSSRILYLWDVTLTAAGAEQTPSGRTGGTIPFAYGVEYTKAHLDDELDGTPTGFVRSQDTDGHGTHVAGTAAGNGRALAGERFTGIAPEADLLIIKGGNGSFTETNQINGLQYARQIAQAEGKPVVMNMSLGGQSGAHDGTRASEVAIDNFTGPGRVVAVAAGNDGASNLHYTGSPANGNSTSHTITIGAPTAGLANNFAGLETWFSAGGNINITVTAPNGTTIVSSVGNVDQAVATNQGSVEIYHSTLVHPSGHRQVRIFLGDFGNAPNDIEIATGNWTVQFTNVSGGPVTYHGWRTAQTGLTATIVGGDNTYSVSTPGTASEAITVGSYFLRRTWRATGGIFQTGVLADVDNLSSFSGKGPRRDGAMKPDLTAPGQMVGSVRSSNRPASASNDDPSNLYYFNVGTSMATPVVAGCAALLLQQKPTADWSEIRNALTSTAAKDTYTGPAANNNWGHGKTDVYRAMISLVNPASLAANQRTLLAYDDWAGDLGITLGSGTRAAVRISPTFSGQLTSMLYYISGTSAATGPVSFELWTNVADNPGALIPGAQVSFAANRQNNFSWNHIDFAAANIQVTAGTDYWLVVYNTAAENFSIRHDNSLTTAPIVRSKIFTGTWANAAGDYRIRAIVTQKDNSIVWNGATWLGGTPASTLNAAVMGAYPNGVAGQGTFSVNNLIVHQGHTLTLGAGQSVTVAGGLQNEGSVVVQANGALVQTSATNQNAGTGTLTAQRGLTKPNAGYNFISAPVSGQSIGSVTAGAPFPNNRFRFDPTQATPSARWVLHSGNLDPGVGYTFVSGAGSNTLAFTGPANNADVAVPLTGTASSRFNLVGNPYPSPVSLPALFTGNNDATTGISGSAWLWDDNDNNTGTGSYVVSNGVTPTTQVAVGQGFFVLANSNSGTLTFRNSYRATGSPTFYRNEGPEMERLQLTVRGAQDRDELWVAFSRDFTEGFDRGYDAQKLDGATNLSIAAVVDNERMAVVALPETGGKRFELPLTLFVRQSGTYTFATSELDGPVRQPLFIEDRATGEYYLLRPGQQHTLAIQAGNYRDRFILRSSSEVVGAQLGETAGAYSFGRELFVETSETAQVTVYTSMGTKVQQFDQVRATSLRRLPVEVRSAGVYVVRVATPSGTLEKRVWLEP